MNLNNIKNIKENEDLNTYILDLCNHFKEKIIDTYCFTYSKFDKNPVAFHAFEEKVKEQLGNSLKSYLKSDKSKDPKSYFLFVINKVGTKVYWELSSSKRIPKAVCPACLYFGNKIFLNLNDKLYSCTECDEIIKNDSTIDESKLYLRKIFKDHKSMGVACGDCNRFIPNDFTINEQIVCPYPGCFFVGHIDDLKKMSHPRSLAGIKNVEMDTDYSFSSSLKNDSQSDDISEASFSVKEDINDKINILIKIINNLTKDNSIKIYNIIKKEMCGAYLDMLEEFPQEMMSYLIYKNHSYGIPIQSYIFRKFISRIEKSLPIKCMVKNKEKIITDILDGDLNIFWGRSEFISEVNNKMFIQNKTEEHYIGGNNMKDYGPCFLGKLISITDLEGNSLEDNIIDMSFSKINVKNLKVGTKVKIEHYRIPSHYELGALVTLRKIRKLIIKELKNNENNTINDD